MTTTHHEYRGFVFTITYQAQEPAYTVNYPDFPAIITSAPTWRKPLATPVSPSICISKACRS